MFAHIMVPLDGSELAERALPCAERLAVAAGATLHLVRIVEPPAWPAYVPLTRAPRHGRAPLLLVRAFGAPMRLQHAIVPLDGSERAETALRVVAQLAPQVVSEATLLRVIAAPEEASEADRYLAETAHRLQQTQVA